MEELTVSMPLHEAARASDSWVASEKPTTLHRLVDSLRPEDVSTAQRVLQALNTSGGPLLAALAATEGDDEPETESEREAVAQTRRDLIEQHDQ